MDGWLKARARIDGILAASGIGNKPFADLERPWTREITLQQSVAELLGGAALGASKCPTLTAPRTPLDQYRPILPLVFVIKAIGKIAPRLRMSAFGAKRTLPLFDDAILASLRVGEGRACFVNEARMAEPEGFEPSIRLYNRITV